MPLPMGEVAHKVGRRGHFPSQSCPAGMPALPKGEPRGAAKMKKNSSLSNSITINVVGAAFRRPRDGKPVHCKYSTNWNWRRLHLPLPMGEVAHKVGRRGHFPSQACPVGMPALPKGEPRDAAKMKTNSSLSHRLASNIVGAAIRRPRATNGRPYIHTNHNP